MTAADDFQARSTRDGADFEHLVERLLQAEGWDVVGRHALIGGVTVDFVALDPLRVEWTIEAKGSWEGDRPGAKRSDTVKKAIADAWHFSIQPGARPHMLITSHLPGTGVGALLLREALRHGLFRSIRQTGFAEEWDGAGDD